MAGRVVAVVVLFALTALILLAGYGLVSGGPIKATNKGIIIEKPLIIVAVEVKNDGGPRNLTIHLLNPNDIEVTVGKVVLRHNGHVVSVHNVHEAVEPHGFAQIEIRDVKIDDAGSYTVVIVSENGIHSLGYSFHP